MPAFAPVSTVDLFSDGVLADPYPAYATLRATGAAVRLERYGVWAIARHADLVAILRDPAGFGSEGGVALTDLANSQLLAGTVLACDAERHTRLRRVLSRQLAPRAIRSLIPTITMRAERLVAEHVAGASFDAVALARHMVCDTVLALMGLPQTTRDSLLSGAAATFDVFGPDNQRHQRALPAASRMVDFLHRHVTPDSVTPGSWMHAIFQAVDAGEIAASDAIPLASSYAAASMDTTILGIATAITQLADHPEQWALLRRDPIRLATPAFHEALRLEAPVQGLGRLVTSPVLVGGVRLEAGEQVWMLYGSAGRDQRQWGPEADSFVINRLHCDRHLAFGSGAHLCAGISLAELQARSLLRALAARCRYIAPAGPPTRVLNNLLRGWKCAPIVSNSLDVPPLRAGAATPPRRSSQGGQPELAVPDSASAAPASTGDIRRELRAEIRRIGRISGARAGVSVTATVGGYDAVYRLMEKWLPLAERRREAAAGSRADRARWARLIDLVRRPERRLDTSYEGLVVLAAHARELLGALGSTEAPFVAVVDVARRIEEQITHGLYAVGALLSPGRIGAELGVPQDSVHLALDDLAERGLIERQGSCRARVQGSRYRNERPGQIADLLRELIAAGVFPSNVMLPSRRELARILISAQGPLGEALCILGEDGTLRNHGPRRRPTVASAPGVENRAAQVARALAVLPEPAITVDLSATGICDVARKARAWWKARLSPDPDSLGPCVDHLCAAARHLVARARVAPAPLSEADQAHLRSTIARTAATAVAMHDLEQELRVWRAACLATAVLDLLALVAPVPCLTDEPAESPDLEGCDAA